ncbi:MAG TPA: DUF4440 domain-containing protein [Acidimicrobiales bacterium]|nr:DUF4440 domain-containing protein [Acidimicrobiales bacterium]
MSVVDEVRDASGRFNRALAGGDASEVASFYCSAARLLPDGAPRVDGRSAIEAFFRQGFDAGFGHLELHTQEVTDAGDLAVEVGRWTANVGEGDRGKYVVVWRREDGALRIDVDIFNSDTRSAG